MEDLPKIRSFFDNLQNREYCESYSTHLIYPQLAIGVGSMGLPWWVIKQWANVTTCSAKDKACLNIKAVITNRKGEDGHILSAYYTAEICLFEAFMGFTVHPNLNLWQFVYLHKGSQIFHFNPILVEWVSNWYLPVVSPLFAAWFLLWIRATMLELG